MWDLIGKGFDKEFWSHPWDMKNPQKFLSYDIIWLIEAVLWWECKKKNWVTFKRLSWDWGLAQEEIVPVWTHWKRLWCWEGLGAGGEGDDRGWDVWMASLTWWIWVWVNTGSWWWTGRPGVLRFMGSQRVGHDWATELNWTELNQGNRDTDTFWILTWQVSHISWIGKGHVQCSSVGKESACNIEDLGSIPELGRSPGEGNGNPLQCSCLENPMDRGAWQATVHGVAKVRQDLVTKSSSSSSCAMREQEK